MSFIERFHWFHCIYLSIRLLQEDEDHFLPVHQTRDGDRVRGERETSWYRGRPGYIDNQSQGNHSYPLNI